VTAWRRTNKVTGRRWDACSAARHELRPNVDAPGTAGGPRFRPGLQGLRGLIIPRRRFGAKLVSGDCVVALSRSDHPLKPNSFPVREGAAMPVIEVVSPDRRIPESVYLLKRAKNIYSQAGEDGILQSIFDIIGTRNKWCVEFGAWDGIHVSNTCHLIKDCGWTCVQIEGDAKKFQVLEENFKSYPTSIRLCRIIGYTPGVDTIDDALKTTKIPHDFDLISIDIDGNDWHIWNSMTAYRPRIVVIEFNPSVPNDVVFIQDCDMAINEGCSLAALIKLGKQKGYELICATSLNGIFVVKEEFDKFGIKDNSIDAMRRTPPGRIFCTYSGKIYHTIEKFGWTLRRVTPTPDMFQVLPPEKMRYGDRIIKS
jgi:hypothetical protein